jgi:hypothetical protein
MQLGVSWIAWEARSLLPTARKAHVPEFATR